MNNWIEINQEEMKIGMNIAGLKKEELQIKYAKDIYNLQQKVEQLENIRKEAIESIERGYVVFCKQDEECLLNFRKNMLNILNKGSEFRCGKN